MASRIKGTVNDFLLGLQGRFPSLEEALTHPQSERKLIDLHAPTTRYDRRKHIVHYEQDGKHHHVKLDPAFHEYMSRYSHSTHYVTDGGTPWLTREQEYQDRIPKSQRDAYYAALTKGENREIILLHWLGTYKHETGHAALSVGTLKPAEGQENEETPVYHYEPEITGSYYGSTTPLLGAKHFNEYFTDARARLGGQNNPIAHAVGTTLRDGAAPLGAMLGGAMLTLITQVQRAKSPRKQRAILRDGIAAISTFALTSTAAAAAGLLTYSNGTLLMKEESEGTGMLATLITPAQRDIMEHSLYGVYQTYHERYNMLNNNCADFASKMLQDISLDLDALVKEALAEEAQPQKRFSRIRQMVAIPREKFGIVPEHIQPGRASWALRTRKTETGVLTLDAPDETRTEQKTEQETEQPRQGRHAEKELRKRDKQTKEEPKEEVLHVSLVDAFDQSSVLIETSGRGQRFREPPIETFNKVLEHALTLRQGKDQRFHFAIRPHVPMLPREQDINFAR